MNVLLRFFIKRKLDGPIGTDTQKQEFQVWLFSHF